MPMFGRCYSLLKERWKQDLSVQASALADALTPAEMAHLTEILQKPDAPVSDEALDDCVRIIREEHDSANVSDADDIRAIQQRMLKKKSYGGT